MTGTEEGLMCIWRKNPGYNSTNSGQTKLKDHSIVTSFNCGGSKPLIKIVDQKIIVASEDGKLLVLDSTLNVKNEYNTINHQPWALSATRQYIAIGTEGRWTYGNEVIFYDRGSTEPMVRIKLKKKFKSFLDLSTLWSGHIC